MWRLAEGALVELPSHGHGMRDLPARVRQRPMRALSRTLASGLTRPLTGPVRGAWMPRTLSVRTRDGRAPDQHRVSVSRRRAAQIFGPATSSCAVCGWSTVTRLVHTTQPGRLVAGVGEPVSRPGVGGTSTLSFSRTYRAGSDRRRRRYAA